jgi:hypothetical protein
MIRVTIDLHVVSKGEYGGYWLSTMSRSEFEDRKKSMYCSSDAELRSDLQSLFDAEFFLVSAGNDVRAVIARRLGMHTDIRTVGDGWPVKINLEKELA